MTARRFCLLVCLALPPLLGPGIAPPAAAADAATYTPLDLRGVVNHDWRDGGDAHPGWTRQGDNDMRGIQAGRRVFGGIPFDLIDPATNGGKAVLALRSQHLKTGVDDVSVPVNRTAGSLYFLHTAAWNSGDMADYIVHYADGAQADIPIRADQEIGNWWNPVNGTAYRAAFHMPNTSTDDVGMYLFGWNNPSPAKPISSLEVRSRNAEGLVLLAGVTLSSQPLNLPPASSFPEPDYLKSDLDTLDTTQWFPLVNQKDPFRDSPIDVSATLDAPAGKHGFLQNRLGHFVFADGTPARFCATLQSPFVPETREQAVYIARWLAKWGFNCVRFHPLVPEVLDANRNDTQHLDPVKMDRLDMLIDELAKRGIYVRFSMLYYRNVKAGDGLEGFNEMLAAHKKEDANANSVSTMALTFFDEKAQQLNIDLERQIMSHKNPYRANRTYGEDPAICMVEVTNEDSMFFYTTDSITPFYKTELDKIWGQWLLAKYGTRAKLAAAWGGHLNADEDPAAGTVGRLAIWEYQNQPAPDRLARAQDQLHFYAELNNRYFTRSKAAMRAVGSRQPVCGSGWFGPNLAFYADLYSNAPGMDYIDRHHYWAGGPGGWQILAGQPFNTETPLTQPEIMLKLSGERVLQLPFGISEWANVLPNQWRCAEPGLMAMYGNSLNGWDVPMHFAHDMGYWSGANGFTKYLKWMWPVNSPETICQYPAISMMLRRKDVAEGQTVLVRRLSDDQVFGARPLKDVAIRYNISGIFEQSASSNDTTAGNLAFYAAAVGKAGVEFTTAATPDSSIDLNPYIDTRNKVIRSETGELVWQYGPGVVTCNTTRDQSAIGFLNGHPAALKDCRISSDNKIAAIHVTSWDGQPLSASKHILITAVARTRNTGMAYSRGGQRLLTMGTEPLVCEGVRGTVALGHAGTPTVTALDPYGYPTGPVPVTRENGRIVIPLDGKYKALYYDVVFR